VCNFQPLPLNKNVLVAERYAANPQYSASLPMEDILCAPPGVQMLDRSNLKLEKELGEGCFGKVYEGACDLWLRSNHCFLGQFVSGAQRSCCLWTRRF